MDSYHIYSQFFDELEEIPFDVQDRIQRYINEYYPEAKSLLEIGCGTGNVLSGLSDIYHVEGLDISMSMLAIAKKKYPEITFHHQDMSKMELDKSFDVIVSVYDSINHLLDREQWRETFKRVRSHLTNDGIFIFDINTIGRVRFLSTLEPWTQKIDGGNISLIIREKAGDRFSWTFTFTRNGDVVETTIEEQILSISEIGSMLQNDFEVLAIDDERGKKGTDDSKQVYFVCKRKM